jgi:hypothetical protein
MADGVDAAMEMPQATRGFRMCDRVPGISQRDHLPGRNHAMLPLSKRCQL